MAMQRHNYLPLTVHFGCDLVEMIEFSSEEEKTGHQRLERNGKRRCIFGEPCPEPNADDITGDEEWLYYYSALKRRFHQAKHQQGWATLKEARWRASRLKKRLSDPHDESHFGILSHERVTDPVESTHLPENVTGGNVDSNRKASLARHRLVSLWSAPRSAIRMPTRFSQSPSEKNPAADEAPAAPERMWCVPTRDRLRIIAERRSTSATCAQRTRIFDWAKRRHSRVHVSLDPIMP
eukprot:TRINITY_DN8434_c0_g2_i2.p1 TRINITY_DN8434_c0_g2~~TRINITY_DN8434_c0_g2_i2.p1  ORF type:complete len:237 (-),score=19.57 TRINITY_DN8434_c0_g2_i2:671-1381(-)